MFHNKKAPNMESIKSYVKLAIFLYPRTIWGKYSRMDQIKSFKGSLPQILLDPFLNTLSYTLSHNVANVIPPAIVLHNTLKFSNHTFKEKGKDYLFYLFHSNP